MKHQFQTVSSARKNVIAVAIVWAVLAGSALLGLLVSAVTCIFLEGMLLLVFLFVLFSVSKTKWGLYFENSLLIITNFANHRQYRLEDLRREDFVFVQNECQKKKNCGHLKIMGCSAVFNDVQQFEALKAYIREHFQ